jgi:hypothetical protein
MSPASKNTIFRLIAALTAVAVFLSPLYATYPWGILWFVLAFIPSAVLALLGWHIPARDKFWKTKHFGKQIENQ